MKCIINKTKKNENKTATIDFVRLMDCSDNMPEEDKLFINLMCNQMVKITDTKSIKELCEHCWVESAKELYFRYAWHEIAMMECIINWLGWYWHGKNNKLSNLYFNYYSDYKDVVNQLIDETPENDESIQKYYEYID